MYYSSIGFLAAVILVIENHDIIFQRGSQQQPAMRIYKYFLLGIMAYYITDILWGILDSCHLITLLFIDTSAYYVAMGLGLLLWTRYLIAYLNDQSVFGRALFHVGWIFFAALVAVTVLNIFFPVLFTLDENGVYHAYAARYVFLILQILLFILTAVYAFLVMLHTHGSRWKRYRTIGLFGLTMALLLTLQYLYPLLPLYAAGYMLGTCLLHTFVFGDEKEEYRQELEQSVLREKKQREELQSTWKLAYTDPLTHVKSKLSFSEAKERLDRMIEEDPAAEFAVAVFDVNGLKETNDRLGHEAGDQLLINASRLICRHFTHSPVFRIGGDEFAAVLEGGDYRNRQELMDRYDQQMEENRRSGEVIAAGGLATFRAGRDENFDQVFERADQRMYERKRALKD